MRLPSNPVLQLTPPRVANLLNTLRWNHWQDYTPLPCEATEPTGTQTAWADASARPRRTITAPCYWGRKFDHRWFRFVVPPAAPGDDTTRYLFWHDQGEATL